MMNSAVISVKLMKSNVFLVFCFSVEEKVGRHCDILFKYIFVVLKT